MAAVVAAPSVDVDSIAKRLGRTGCSASEAVDLGHRMAEERCARGYAFPDLLTELGMLRSMLASRAEPRQLVQELIFAAATRFVAITSARRAA